MRYFLRISYQGTHYHGWQYQNNAISIQEIIESKINILLKGNYSIVGSSRTDAGVHAENQCAHIDINYDINIQNFKYRLNSMLPNDIAINDIYPVNDDTHARFSAKSRLYHYNIIQVKNPFITSISYRYFNNLDLNLLNEAADIIKNTHDFESFSKLGTISAHGYDCKIFESAWIHNDNKYIYIIKANRFLRGMVRALVNNMLYVGCKRISLDRFIMIVNSRDRSKSLGLAPANGLILKDVYY